MELVYYPHPDMSSEELGALFKQLPVINNLFQIRCNFCLFRDTPKQKPGFYGKGVYGTYDRMRSCTHVIGCQSNYISGPNKGSESEQESRDQEMSGLLGKHKRMLIPCKKEK